MLLFRYIQSVYQNISDDVVLKAFLGCENNDLEIF